MLLLKMDLYKIARARLRDDNDIYDAIQETMLMAFKSIKQLRQVQYFKSWLIKILINQINNTYKKMNRMNIISIEEIENIRDYSHTNNIEEKLDLNFICKNLKYDDRLIILLYYAERFTDKEIGQILNLKENTVKTKRTRAKQEIKKILEKGETLYG